ncbi:fimbrial protein [Enterobacter sp. Acro-832]|nr:fimbrial protein [Enterobacter sp. Acro-832]
MAVASLAVLNSIQPLRADDPKNLEMKGTLITPPPCNLNGGNTVHVSFGDKVGIRKVASGVYRQPVLLDLECEDNNLAWQMTLAYTGTPASFDTDNATVVTAQQAALGVKIYADGQPLPIDKVLRISGDSLPQLEAVLVQKPDIELSEGEFTARASLMVAYE